jgi:hypothetical protein
VPVDDVEYQQPAEDQIGAGGEKQGFTIPREYQKHDIYLSLSGGRKTMSAIMTIAAQIYGAKKLCHVVPLDDELERLGEIRCWSTLPQEKQQEVLHPPAEKVRLVRLPLVSLFPMLDDFLRALQARETPIRTQCSYWRTAGWCIARVGISSVPQAVSNYFRYFGTLSSYRYLHPNALTKSRLQSMITATVADIQKSRHSRKSLLLSHGQSVCRPSPMVASRVLESVLAMMMVALTSM